MGFYNHYILPRFLNAAMGTKPIRYQRKKVVPRAEGRVLEVGFGAGHNLPFYDASKVSHIWALEPAREMRERAAERVAESKIPLEFLDLPGEQIPLDNESADTILITYTLCTIPDVMAALGQMRRVLKNNGRMIFCEHGEAPDDNVRKWQRRLTPAWKAIGGGCHVGRQIPKVIADGGFRIDDMETMYLPGTPRFAGFNYWGSAIKGLAMAIIPGRFTAQTDKPVVLFLIGMRINNFLALSDIIFMSKTMPAMLKELSEKKDSGMLWFQTNVSLPRYISVQQYWESFDKLLAYAHAKDAHHFPMWVEFNKRISKSKNIGIWHETYLVEPGKFECVYGNMPKFGLAAATSHVPAEGRLAQAKDRFAS